MVIDAVLREIIGFTSTLQGNFETDIDPVEGKSYVVIL